MVNSHKNNRGQVLVLVALSLVVLLGFAALAIDVGYFYHTKHQLQGAADAAALAGAAKLGASTDTVQTAAKAEAVTYGGLNKASGSAVDPDVTVGYWSSATSTYRAGITPVNAVQVKASRTQGDAAGFPRFFGKLFDSTKQNIWTEAIATKPARSSTFISMCLDSCNNGPTTPCYSSECIINPARVLESNPALPENTLVWTTLTTGSANANELSGLICGESPAKDNCGESIWLTNGTLASAFQDFESAMYNLDYQKSEKLISGSTVTAWTVIVPLIQNCPPPGGGGGFIGVQEVKGYAKIRITKVCAPGGGSVCYAGSSPPGACTGGGSRLEIDRIQCVLCANQDALSGRKPVLVH